jgi:WD40 repeat protein
MIATSGQLGAAQIWQASDGALVRTIPVPTSAHNVHFSPDDTLLVVATVDGKVNIWNVQTGALALGVTTTSEMADADYSPDGRRIASTGDGNVVQIWDAASGTRLQVLTGHSAYISHVVWVDSDRLLSDDWSGGIKLWQRDASGSFALAKSWSTGGQGLGMAVLPDRSAFAVGASGGGVDGFAFYLLDSAPTRALDASAGE